MLNSLLIFNNIEINLIIKEYILMQYNQENPISEMFWKIGKNITLMLTIVSNAGSLPTLPSKKTVII